VRDLELAGIDEEEIEARDPEWADIDEEEKEKREIWSEPGVFGKRAGLKF